MTPEYTTRSVVTSPVAVVTCSAVQAGSDYLTREYMSKEARISELKVQQ